MRQDKDRSGKWLIDHHGDSILKLANISGFTSWRAAQSELVAPRRLPDGLLEVAFPNRPGTDPFIIEIETYADRGIGPQVFEDILITRIERGVIPDVIALILRRKGALGLKTRPTRKRTVRLWALVANRRTVSRMRTIYSPPTTWA